jgi:membrane associated rhomboid family serine protease
VRLEVPFVKLRYNAPIVLSYSIICAVVLLINQITAGLLQNMFSVSPYSVTSSPLSWYHLVTHVIGHQNWQHLIGNLAFILLIGPILEEKYGSGPVLLMMVVTAVATGVLDLLIERAMLFGASGIVFMFILLSSFTNIRSGEIPITFILIVVLYVVKEIWDALTPDSVSHLTHIAGGIVGGAFGFLFAKSAAAAPKTPAPPDPSIGGKTP